MFLLLGSMVIATISGCAAASDEPVAPPELAAQPTEQAAPEAAEQAPDDSASPDAVELEEIEDSPADPASHPAGEVTLSWTGGVEQQNFSYTAEHCYIGTDYILVEGVGGPIDAPEGSSIKVFTTPEELLHEATGTFQAAGAVQFTWGDAEIVADGRMIHVGTYPQPAVFTYRQTDDSVKYVVSWFDGAADAGSGAVEVQCSY